MSDGSGLRILMTSDAVGGVWTYSCALAASLVSCGCEVSLVTIGPRPRAEQCEMLRGSRVRLLQTDLALEWQDPEGRNAADAEHVLGGLESKFRPNIVHINGFREATFAWNAPTVVVAHSCVNSWAVACGDTAWLQEPRWQSYTKQVAAALDKADAWVCPSRSFHDEIINIYQPRSRGGVIWNGISPRPLAGSKQDFIFAAGRLWDRAKNINVLAAAAPGLEWPVMVAGPAEAQLPAGVTWLGELPHAEMGARLQQAGIFVSPALYEPFGLSVLEAAASGCALVLSDIPTFRELWDGAALFVDPTDSAALHRTLSSLCGDADRRERLQQAAYERSLTYTLARMTGAYLKLYQDLLASRRAEAPADLIEVRA